MLHNILLTFFAYLLDKKFGEFSFLTHPVISIGKLITFFENHFYKDSIAQGGLLVIFVLTIVYSTVFTLEIFLDLLPTPFAFGIESFVASMFIAHTMLKEAVLGVVHAKDKHHAISMLVSRDTQDLSESDIYKAAIETYAENLSDGVLAPMFYLLLFGLPGIILYKAINTMDSMVGYRNKKYENFGKVAARLDDIANYIPARLTALLIMLRAKQHKLFAFYQQGKLHDSPNAGHPITAMALALGVQLGGDTSYFGKVKKKAVFGRGKNSIEANDVHTALSLI